MRRDLTFTATALPVLIFAASLAAFWPAADAEFLNWDDGLVVTQNHAFRGFDRERLEWMWTTSWAGHYQPLTWMSLAADFERFGLEPPERPDASGYHRGNLILHAAGAVAFYAVALQILSLSFAAAGRRAPTPLQLGTAAAFAALLFALHPLRCESVCWVTERRDVLAGLFFGLALAAYLRGAPLQPPSAAGGAWRLVSAAAGAAAIGLFFVSVSLAAPSAAAWSGPGASGLALAVLLFGASVAASLRASGGRRGWLLACHGLVLLSLLAKAWAVVVPALLLALDAWPLQRWLRFGASAGSAPRAALDLRAAGALLLEKSPLVVTSVVFARLASWAQTAQQGDVAVWEGHTLGERLVQALYGIAWYPLKTLWPVDLVPIHEIPRQVTLQDPAFLAAACFSVAVTAVLVVLARRRPWLLVAWLAYGMILSPVLGIFQSGPQLVADRYSYLAGMPFALLAGGAWLVAAQRSPAAARGALAAGVALVLALGTLSWRQSAVWESSERLWEHTLAVAPETAMAHLNLAILRNGQAQAEPDPARREARRREVEELLRRGAATGRYPQLFQLNAAIVLWHRATEGEGPEHDAMAAEAARQASEAIGKLETGGAGDALHFWYAGRIFLRAGQIDEAVAQFERAVSGRPQWPEARLGLANALIASAQTLGMARPDAALAQLGAAIEQLESARTLGADDVALRFLRASARDLEGQILSRLARDEEAGAAWALALREYRSLPVGGPRSEHVRSRIESLGASAAAP